MARVLPNLLSWCRLLLGLVFPLVPESWWLTLVAAAALSDLLDGQISRRFHATSETGRLLDPIADKLFVISVLATLAGHGVVAIWQLALIGARDLAVLAGAGWILVRRGWGSVRAMRPSLAGKAATAAQFLFLGSVLIFREVFWTIFAVTAATSTIAALDYLLRHGRMPDQSPDDSTNQLGQATN
jgi:phosphatidylglycerophosphate synthase